MKKGKGKKRSAKDIVDSTRSLISSAANRVMERISPSVHIAPEGLAKNEMMFSYNLDTLPKSEIVKIQKDLSDGAKIMFTSSAGQAGAKDALLALGLDEKYASSVFVVCDEGHRVLHSQFGKFSDSQTDVGAPKRNAEGNLELDKNRLPQIVVDSRSHSFSSDQMDKIENYAKSIGLVVAADKVSGTIKILGADRNAQVFHAANLIDSLALTPEELEDYGINFTRDGVIIRPATRSIVNAEYTVCALSKTKPENVRRVASTLGEINNNVTLESFMNLFTDESGKRISAEEASRRGILDRVPYDMFEPERDFDTIDTKTQNGTWFQRWGRGNRKDLREVHLFIQDRAYKINHAEIDGRGKNFKLEPCVMADVSSTFYDAMMPTSTGISYAQRFQAEQDLLKATRNMTKGIDIEENEKLAKQSRAIIKEFNAQTDWHNDVLNSVLDYVSGVPKAYKAKKGRNRISSFLHGVVSRDKMPESKAADLPEFLALQDGVFEKAEAFNEYMQSIEDPAEKARLSAVFSGYMISWERKIKKGATEEEILGEMESFFETHTKEIEKKDEDESTITPPPVEPDKTEDEDSDTSTPPGGESSEPPSGGDGDGRAEEEEDEEALKQQYLDQLILKHTIEADKQMLSNIVRQYDGNEEAAKDDPNYIYFSSQLESHQTLLDSYKEIEKPVKLEGIDERKLGNAVEYGVMNVYTNQYNFTIQKLNEKGQETRCKPLPLYEVPESLKKSNEFQSVAQIISTVAEEADMDIKLGSEIHNELLKHRQEVETVAKNDLLGTLKGNLLEGSIFASVVENSLYNKDEIDVEVFTAAPKITPGTSTVTPEVPTVELPEMIDAFKQFSYVPSITVEQTNKNFNKSVINMTNLDLWKFNRYHGIVTSNMEEYLKSRGYSDGTMIKILKELNAAFVVQEGLTQDKATTYKAQGKLKDFEKAYDEICEKYADNPAALKQAKEIFMFQMDEARRLDIYRKEIAASGKGYTFRGKKAKSEDELLGMALKEDLNKDSGKVLAMIQTSSQNVREYNMFKFDVQTSFEATEQQFGMGVLKPSLDSYKFSRAFTGEMLLGMKTYLEKCELTDTKEFEIFEKLASAWNVDVNKKTPANAVARDKELSSFEKQYKIIVKEYGDDPAALKRAEDMFMVCVGQARVVGEMFKEDNPNKTWETLRTADKGNYAKRFEEKLNDDRDVAVQAIRTATLLAGVNEVKNSARHLSLPAGLGETSDLAVASGAAAVADEELIKKEEAAKKRAEAKKKKEEELKTAAVAKKASSRSRSGKNDSKKNNLSPKRANKKKDEPKIEKEEDNLAIAREQLVLSNSIINAQKIRQQILANYQGNEQLAKQDPMFRKLDSYIETSKAKLDKNIEINGNQKTKAKGDSLAVGSIVTNEVISKMAYNSVISMTENENASSIEQRFSDKVIDDVKKSWEDIVMKKAKGLPLTSEQEFLLENTPMWNVLIDEMRRQNELKKAQGRNSGPEKNVGATERRDAEINEFDEEVTEVIPQL